MAGVPDSHQALKSSRLVASIASHLRGASAAELILSGTRGGVIGGWILLAGFCVGFVLVSAIPLFLRIPLVLVELLVDFGVLNLMCAASSLSQFCVTSVSCEHSKLSLMAAIKSPEGKTSAPRRVAGGSCTRLCTAQTGAWRASCCHASRTRRCVPLRLAQHSCSAAHC